LAALSALAALSTGSASAAGYYYRSFCIRIFDETAGIIPSHKPSAVSNTAGTGCAAYAACSAGSGGRSNGCSSCSAGAA